MSKKKIIGIIIFITAFFCILCWFSYMHITGADIEFIANLDEADYVNMTVSRRDAFTGDDISSEEYKLNRKQIKELHSILASSGFVLDFNEIHHISSNDIRTDVIIYGSFTNDEEGYYIYFYNGDFVDIRLKNGTMLIPVDKDLQDKILEIVK